MQTIYFETDSFIRHEGNLVDLAAYRQKLSAVSGESWTPGAEAAGESTAQEPPDLTLLSQREAEPPKPHRRHVRRARRLALALDLCASLAVVALTVAAAVGFLRL